MSISNILITTERRADSRVVADFIRSTLDSRHGDPVVPISLLRLVIRHETMVALGATTTDQLEQRLSPVAVRATEIGDARVAELLNGRSQPELPVSRPPPSEPEVGTTYDWHLHACAIPQAWSLIAGGNFSAIDWQAIRVGHVDTGYRPHRALGWSGTTPTFVDTTRDRNFCARDVGLPGHSINEALDPLRGGAFDGHGTRTSSVLAGRYQSSSSTGTVTGYFGAAPGVPIVPVRISDSVLISDEQDGLAKAIHHLVNEQCKVISLSMGFPLFFGAASVKRVVRDAVNLAYDRGVIVVCASGNYLHDVVAPAALSRTIAVGGTTPSDDTWQHGSCGPEVDICAPASDVYRASVDRGGAPIYGLGDGTSFATALVAGVAALWHVHHGGAITAKYTQPWQVAEAFKRLLKSTARRPNGWDTGHYGAGIVSAFDLLSAPLHDPATWVPEPPNV